jgi:hypothetical protein
LGTQQATGNVQLQFTDNSTDEAGFRIERKEQGQPDTAYAQVATAAASVPASQTGGTIFATDATAQADKTY